MARGSKTPARPLSWGKLLWQASALLLTVAVCAQSWRVWTRGAEETQDAYDQGRRLLVTIETGAISGSPYIAPPAATATPPARDTALPAEEKSAESAPEEPAAPATEAPEPEPELPPVPPQTEDSLSEAPLPGMSERTQNGGLLPVISRKGEKSWQRYARDFQRPEDKAVVAIVLTGLGQNKSLTQNAIELPREVSLSFSPYAKDTPTWALSARRIGHEVLLDMPLEPANYPASDPGLYGLMTGKNHEENLAKLTTLMTVFPGYIGFLTAQNERFTGSPENMKPIVQELNKRGLMLVFGQPIFKEETIKIAENSGAPALIADVVLDEELSSTAIQNQLSNLEQIAKKRGYAVGIGQAYPVTLKEMNGWIPQLAAKGLVIAPVSAAARIKYP